MPIITTDKKYIINQLLIKIEVSLLMRLNFMNSLLLLFLLNIEKIIKDRNIKKNKKNKINKPLSGSFAKVWTELSIPDLTKNVPDTLNINF